MSTENFNKAPGKRPIEFCRNRLIHWLSKEEFQTVKDSGMFGEFYPGQPERWEDLPEFVNAPNDNPPASNAETGQRHTPDIKTLIGRMLNKHYAMAADEHKEGASDSSVKRHYDESNEAENAVYAALDSLLAQNEAMRRALEAVRDTLKGTMDYEHAVIAGEDPSALNCKTPARVVKSVLAANQEANKL